MDIGKQINELREHKNIDLKELAIGICTDDSLRNIELGKESVNKLFTEILFQRLGKSTDKLELIVSEEVYKAEEQMEYFEECLERGDGKQAAEVLELWKKEAAEDSNVHKMFYCRSKAYAEFRVGQNPEKAKEWMQKALDITMPGWQERPLEEYWISTMELENLLAYAKTQLAIGTEPEIKEAEQLAKRALKELQDYGISYFMEPLLEVLVECTENKAQKPHYREYLVALQHVKRYVGEDWHFTDSIF